MKMKKILFRTILITLLIITCNYCACYAAQVINNGIGGGSGETTSDTSGGGSGVGLPNLDLFEPQPTSGGKATSIISSILGVLTVIGIIAIVISIALIGFNMLLGSASEKAAGQEKYGGLVIAALLITGGSIVARLIISVAETL